MVHGDCYVMITFYLIKPQSIPAPEKCNNLYDHCKGEQSTLLDLNVPFYTSVSLEFPLVDSELMTSSMTTLTVYFSSSVSPIFSLVDSELIEVFRESNILESSSSVKYKCFNASRALIRLFWSNSKSFCYRNVKNYIILVLV